VLKHRFGLSVTSENSAVQTKTRRMPAMIPTGRNGLGMMPCSRKETCTVYNSSTTRRIKSNRSRSGTIFIVKDPAHKSWTKVIPLLISSTSALPASKTPKPR